ncbi:MerR family transcriptional regulator [Microbacterium sp. EYE_5]|uniref:MerR family transcriptional regulator n=1 Tax=unclassified Microbacterium TaxID=2609290 RepID=UPI0020063BBB|nr:MULTISPECIES: MerR family transcriptional regulator [unclassified Microbacterium]MCK6081817.1 MerR family transcriptional regulator [Microbacterium sp. EYE_382]MCK6087087.1 MerR family transcriptional regulator [Microbacterium sp. EYE_384]MCK6124935.1 MerR family transcriptional regulator [Microbacterium sp. EYE_80]MCK6127850.1 MerR family transcriptional regulator [Microbacterium sp. EYE_79]MCK6142771.1 MerR family transcriptional regulator [Microbacterium sp. EYE_39]
MSLLSDAAPPGVTIAEAAEATGVSAHTLRYYERAGLMLHPVDRASSSHRRYSDADLGWIRFLARLRWTGMPIATMRRYTELARDGAATVAERRRLLVEHREVVRRQLDEVTLSLAAIDYKIDTYDKEIATS